MCVCGWRVTEKGVKKKKKKKSGTNRYKHLTFGQIITYSNLSHASIVVRILMPGAKVYQKEVSDSKAAKGASANQEVSTKHYFDAAKLTVSCLVDTFHGSSHTAHPTQDAQMYLQRRVAKIVCQLKNASSAHHFYRHVVEIDELLRCDSPLGFTPSMIFAGVPDILYMLADAVQHGYLLRSSEVGETTLRALTPVRQSHHAVSGRTIKPIPVTTASPIKANTESHFLACENWKGTQQLHQNCKGVAQRLTGSVEAVNANILPFLPPLVRRSISQQREAVLNTSGTAATFEASESQVKLSASARAGKRRPRDKAQRPRKLENSGAPLLGTNTSTPVTQSQCAAGSIPDKRQQQQQQVLQYEQALCDTTSSSNLVSLRDIPSALQALLYHCALPLICLTPEDHRHRISAICILASAMASMLNITIQAEKKLKSSSTEGNEEQTDVLTVDHDNQAHDNCNNNNNNNEDILFCIRRSALASLNALLTFIDLEGTTCVNRHFASRDQKRYDGCGAPKSMPSYSSDRENQSQIIDNQGNKNLLPLSKLPPADSGIEQNVHPFSQADKKVDALQRSQYRQRVFRSAPVSIYNGAVATNVLVSLMERWTVIFSDPVSGNALLDSAKQLLRRRDTVLPENGFSKKCAGDNRIANTASTTGVEGSAETFLKISDQLTVRLSEVRMAETNAEEIYLILRAVRYISTYKHHVRDLILLDTSRGATYMSLPALLCLTMARSCESDRCFPLCVECMWNLLEVIPDETVQAILHHEMSIDTSAKCSNERSLFSLSASESLLYSFCRVLLLGYRLDQRELRNDLMVLFIMLLDRYTAIGQGQLGKRTQVGSSTCAGLVSLLPLSTITAINIIASVVFDVVCVPELRVGGRSAQMSRLSLDLLRRYHTVLSPTMRVENTQFKILGWNLLSSFYRWQESCFVMEQKQSSLLCKPNIEGDEYDCADGSLPFDVCHCGLIKVLLLYVDTECDNELVLAWTREELFMLQENAWQVILGLMEFALPLPPVGQTHDTCTLEEDAVRGIEEDEEEKVGERIKAGINDKTVVATVETIKENNKKGLFLSRADAVFVANSGIQCALRYIQTVVGNNAESMVCLVIRILLVLSQCSSHRCELLSRMCSNASVLSFCGETVPLILSVVVRVIQHYIHLERPFQASAVLATLTTTAPHGEISKTITLSRSTLPHTKTIASTNDGLCNNQPQKQHPRPKASALLLSTTGFKSSVEDAGHVPVRFSAGTFDIITHSLLLLHNIVGGDASDVLLTQQAFMSMGGVSLLLTLARHSVSLLLASLPFSSVINENEIKLFCAVIDCIRVFVLGNEVAQRQFVEEEGVHNLLFAVMVFANQHQKKSAQDSIECVAENYVPLSLVLTTLADLLNQSTEAREAFLRWVTYELQDPIDMEDDGRTNATQLLLRLWNEEEKTVGDIATTSVRNKPVLQSSVTLRNDATEVPTSISNNSTNGEEEDYNINNCNYAMSCFQKTMQMGKFSEQRLRSNCDAVDDSKKPVGVPVFRVDLWGLEGLGLRGRDSVVAELQSRYAELERGELAGVAAGTLTRRARLRVAVSLYRVLGLRAKVYACLAAVGFGRLLDVKLSPLERVKLLHAAALPSLCEDEVWGAVAEAVDLREHAVIVPTGVSILGDSNGKNVCVAASKHHSAFPPILSDAICLVKIFSDVEARTTELQNFTQFSVDVHTAREHEATQRFLLSRLRQGGDDAGVVSLVLKARSCNGFTDTTNEAWSSAINTHRSLDLQVSQTTPDKRKFSTPALTVLQKKRKRDAMIKNSFRQH